MGRLFAGTEFFQPQKCDRCSKLVEECRCPPLPSAPAPLIPPEKQTAKLQVENRKKGKVVTVIRGLPAIGNDLPALLTLLKNSCGAGGSIDGDQIEVQGNHLQRIKESLAKLGYKVKG